MNQTYLNNNQNINYHLQLRYWLFFATETLTICNSYPSRIYHRSDYYHLISKQFSLKSCSFN